MSRPRTFTQPQSLNESLATMSQNGNAKEATQAFPKESREPLASHTNPKSRPGVTYAAQDKLAKLPIPDLEASCKRYVSALEPLQSRREHQDTKAAVAEFLRSEGPELHERLKKYATGKSSYIEQFCEYSLIHP